MAGPEGLSAPRGRTFPVGELSRDVPRQTPGCGGPERLDGTRVPTPRRSSRASIGTRSVGTSGRPKPAASALLTSERSTRRSPGVVLLIG